MAIQINLAGTWQEVSWQDFLELVRRGVIRPDTEVIVNDQKVAAARLKGVVFPSQVAVPPPPPVLKQSFCTNCGNAIPERAGACIHCGTRVVAGRANTMPFIIAGIAVVAVAGIVCLAVLLSKIGGGNVTNLSLGDIIPAALTAADVTPPTMTAAERAEADPYITRHGRDAIVCYLQDEKNSNTDKNLVTKYVKYFVSQGADVNVQDGYVSPLSLAVHCENVDLVKFLVSQGADLGEKNSLLCLAAGRDIELVKYFVSKGADVNADNGSPLRIAVRNGNIEVVKYLASKRADLSEKNRLLCLAASENIEVVKFFVSQGADVNAKDGNAVDFINSDLVSKGEGVVLAIFYQDQKYEGDLSPLHFAARSGKIEVIKFLISQGADINAKGDKGTTPLDLARNEGMEEIRSILSGGNNGGQREPTPPQRGDAP